MKAGLTLFLIALSALTLSLEAQEESESTELAKQLANPLAHLISMPTQLNYDQNIGPGDEGSIWQLNIQPVIPFPLTDGWYVISRTILPVIGLQDIPDGNDEFGIGDTFQSLFISPEMPTKRGWIWGVGPAMLLPTASDDLLGAEKWAAGPTAVVLKQEGPWTVGGLANHVWSFAGDADRANVSLTYFEPWVSYTTSTSTTFSLSTEINYDWEAEDWSVPLLFTVDQLFQLGEQYIQLTGALKYWSASPDDGPEGFGFRLQVTFLFPK